MQNKTAAQIETEIQTDSLQLAKDAINHVLDRIRLDENIRYHMGAFTQSFALLKAAHSALHGISPAAIEAEVFERELPREPYAVIVDEIKELFHGDESETTKWEKLKAILERA